ncbi:MAG: hypothetical protein EON48_01120 [Acetobacteraceae bacterium]|jgi:hypothetical protein|nr:MAG: hypothetical protein EON48_01120 [Acetobacteraceae bacterium]
MIDKLQVIVAVLWPLLKWILAIDVTWQFVRMLYFWHTPGVYAGWTFLAHFAVLVALTCFLGVRRSRGALR